MSARATISVKVSKEEADRQNSGVVKSCNHKMGLTVLVLTDTFMSAMYASLA